MDAKTDGGMEETAPSGEDGAGDALGASVTYPYPEPPLPGETIELAPGVHWHRTPLPFKLNHINLWLIEDTEGWIVVDCGFSLDETKEAWRRLFAEAMEGRPITRIIVTHYHPDHMGLAAWLAARSGAEVVMTKIEWQTAKNAFAGVTNDVTPWAAFYRSHGLDPSYDETIRLRGNTYRRGVPELPAATVPMKDADEIALGGHDWRVIVGRGHAPEHAALYCKDLNVLISGDQILPRITPNISLRFFDPDADPLGLYLASFAPFRPLPADVFVLPSHNLPFYGLGPRIDQILDHHDDRLQTVLDHCDTPMTAAELIPHLFKRKLDAHGVSFAMGECLAHIRHLELKGRLRRITGDDGIHRFVRID